MSERWIQTCERLLEEMRRLSEKKDKDRLDLVQSVRFALYALHRSLLGWMNWVNNPDIMAAFNKEELDDINKRIIEFTESFIKYDVKVTQQGAQKNLGTKKAAREVAERRSLEDLFYV
ncbi:MAG: DUF2153 family protein [Candidatus Bathyarchaeia archaeon]